MFAHKKAQNNVDFFCDLISKHKRASQLENWRHGATGRRRERRPRVLEIKITFRLAVNVAFFLSHKTVTDD